MPCDPSPSRVRRAARSRYHGLRRSGHRYTRPAGPPTCATIRRDVRGARPPSDRAMLEGDQGDAARLAMRIVTEWRDVSERRAPARHHLGPHRRMPATTALRGSISPDASPTRGPGSRCPPRSTSPRSICCIPISCSSTSATSRGARDQMDAYVAMGCRSTWTCAPYQLARRDRRSASTSRGPSRTRSCSRTRCWARAPTAMATSSTSAARSPDARRRPGLHLDEGRRRARRSSGSEGVPERLLADPIAHAADRRGGRARHRHAWCPAIVGLPPAPVTTEDHAQGAVRRRRLVGVGRHVPRGRASRRRPRPWRRRSATACRRCGAHASDAGRPAGGARCAVAPWRSAPPSGRSASAPRIVGRELRATGLLGRRPAIRGAVLRQHRTRCPRPGRARGNGGRGRRSAASTVVTDTCTYITPIIAGARRPGRHRFGEMGVVRPGQPRRRRRVRQHVGVRPFRDRRTNWSVMTTCGDR